MIKKEDISIKKGKGFPLGVSKTECGVQFSYALADEDSCRLVLFNKSKITDRLRIDMDKDFKTGDIFSCIMEADDIAERLMCECEYMYEVNGVLCVDPYARMIRGRDVFGKRSKGIRCGFDLREYDWMGERRPHYSYDEMIMYRMHVRGFTKHKSSGVINRGTYAGICEKADYLKELGINTVFLLPAYDFNEIKDNSDAYGTPQHMQDSAGKITAGDMQINYWGYTGDCAYFAPKASYSSEPCDCVREFKDMVKTLHNAGIEVFLDMHFAKDISHAMILDCLRYWTYECHIDGFKINSDVAYEELIKSDMTLKSVKFLSCYWNRGSLDKRLADCNDGRMVNIRRFVLGDEGQASEYAAGYEPLHEGCGCVQYVADINGFTLMDSVSYNRKHNEANGENGQDGSDYNYSYNYGAEGTARKKAINEMRKKQIKNALTLLFVSLRTPMILAGDEFGNSQKGNNNAYCQDNAISWLDWELVNKNSAIFEYTKKLIKMRKDYIIDKGTQRTCGGEAGTDAGTDIPEVSFHGMLPWITDYAPYSRTLGIMLGSRGIYIAINMNRHDETFQLPILSNDTMWEALLWTSEEPEIMWERGIQKSVICAGSVSIFRSIAKDTMLQAGIS